jgi:outer membrane immunogenic protein
MKKLLLAGLAFGALVAPAFAADMPLKTPVYAMDPPPAPCVWCGFYIGANAGGTWSSDNSVAVNSVLTQDFAPGPSSYGAASAAGASGSVPVGGRSGFIGGGQIGYNWQVPSTLPNTWLVGVEADIQGISGRGSGALGTTVGPLASFFGNPDVVTTSIAGTSKLDYLGTVRGRLGYSFAPAFLLYGTGGLAYGGVKASAAIGQSNNDCFFSPGTCIQGNTSTAGAFSQTRTGWTAGAGFEWLFTRQWSAKAEYLHYDLGSVTFANGALVTTNGTFPGAGGPAVVSSASSTKFSGDIVRVGVNYHWY